MVDAKPLRIRLDKIDGFVKVYDGTRYLVLYNKIRYLIRVNDVITYFFLIIMQKSNVAILVKSVFNADSNYYYYIFIYSLKKLQINYIKTKFLCKI